MTSIDHALLEGYPVRTRWFGGKGRPFRVTGVRELAELPGDGHGPDVGVYLVTVEYQDAEDGTELYQVPLARYEEIEDRHGHAYVGSVQVDGHERHLYDAVHDRDAMALWLRGFIAAETIAYADFIACGGEHGAKQAGKMRQEGRDYVVQDGDVMLFRFNV